MRRFLNRLVGRKIVRTRQTGRKSGFVPRLETLENRWCPSCLITTIDGGHTVKIVGDNQANVVSIKDDAGASDLEVKCDGMKKNFNTDDISKIIVDLKGGDDQFTYELGGGSDFEVAKVIQLKLGKGNDSARFNFLDDGNGGYSMVKADLSIDVKADKGDDQVEVKLGAVDSVNVLVKAQMGKGNDRFLGYLLGDLLGTAHVSVDARGEDGNDTMSVSADFDVANNQSSLDIDAGASLDVVVDGGKGNDDLAFNYLGVLDGQLRLNLNGGKGNDEVFAQIHALADSDGSVDAKVFGDKGNDQLTLKVLEDPGSDLDILNALLDGGKGHDTCVTTPNVTEVNCEA
ncbi:MAG TPA: hypothetical protein VNK04_20675 [Gemmataceae bacterium]|nr:hypothetical protein [Gemmataceae bacterium]